MASKYDFVDGKVVRLVAEDVNDQESHAAELQADLDVKQDILNAAVQTQTNAEAELADAELVAEAKATQLEEAKSAREVAESELAKSLDARGSFTAAVELANSQSVTSEVDSDGEDVETDDEVLAESESVSVDVTVVTAEG